MSQDGFEPTFFVHDAVYLWAIVPFTCWSVYDAVYLYLLTVNQTSSEDSYKDGRLIRNQTVGQRFTGKPSIYLSIYSFKKTLTDRNDTHKKNRVI